MGDARAHFHSGPDVRYRRMVGDAMAQNLREPPGDPMSIAMIYAQTQVLAERIDHTNQLLTRIATELRETRKEDRRKLEALAERQRQIILFLATAIAVIVTAIIGPQEMIKALLPL